MKKLLALSLVCAMGIMACNKKAVPATSTTTTTKTETTKTEPAKTDAEVQADIDARKKIEEANKPAVGAATMNNMDMGKNVYAIKCTSCHAAKTMSNYTASQWDNILRSMVPKAKLSADEEQQVRAYIKANAKQ